MLQRKISKKYDLNMEGRKFVKACNIIKLERILYSLILKTITYIKKLQRNKIRF